MGKYLAGILTGGVLLGWLPWWFAETEVPRHQATPFDKQLVMQAWADRRERDEAVADALVARIELDRERRQRVRIPRAGDLIPPQNVPTVPVDAEEDR